MSLRTLAGLGGALLLVAVAAGLAEHRMLAIRVYALFAAVPPLLPAEDEGVGVHWIDDYYTVEEIDPDTLAIGEPRYHQQVFSFLVLGADRAVLFDIGSGVRDLAPRVAALTSLPVTAVPSHLHFDHVGGGPSFERIALVDLPELRARAREHGGLLWPTAAEHMGFVEGFDRHGLRVSEWWAPESEIDLGGRRLRVLRAPGHTPESIALYDPDRHQLFAGDFLYPGPLIAFAPGAKLADYLEAAERLSLRLPADTLVLGAHRVGPPGAPRLGHGDLTDLRAALRGIRDGVQSGEGLYPRRYPVNARVWLLADGLTGMN